MLLKEFSQGDAHRQLPCARLFYLAAHPVELGARIAGEAQLLEPVRALVNNMRQAAERFYIINNGGFPKKTAHLRKWWFCTRSCTLALQRIEHRRLLTAHI